MRTSWTTAAFLVIALTLSAAAQEPEGAAAAPEDAPRAPDAAAQARDGAAQEPDGAAPDRADAFVASTRVFSFHSDPRVNLHDMLLWRLSSAEPVDARPECLASLAARERRGFEEAAAFYEERLSESVRDRGDVILDLRFHLVGHPGVDIAPDSAVAAAVRRLDAALPAYRACWWPDHDARNRRWIGDVIPRVIAFEDSTAARLSRHYRGDWELPIAVDAAGWGGARRAHTILNPDHVLISAAPGIFEGKAALEILFHEASHTLVAPRHGAVARALAAAAREEGLERPPPELWHVLIFYTTGHVVRTLVAERDGAEYEPYIYATGLFDRAWPRLREPVERHWRPYLEGRIGMEEAARRLVRAVRARR